MASAVGTAPKPRRRLQTAQAGIQKFGGFLSAMVMPWIGIFIAWGLITAFVIPTGWVPNAYLAELVGPTIKYLLPILIGYAGGSKVYGKRGGAIGALATMGVVIGSDVTMLIGGMFMGPIAALALKYIDKLYEGKVKAGLEMLVDNFVLGIVGAVIMILGYIAVEPAFAAILAVLSAGVNWLTNLHLIPLLALFVQPAQVLFLNNAINHGIMIPLGIEQAAAAGKSILFLVEANGGPWVGLLAAFSIFGWGTAKRTAPGAFIIMVFGGIGEVAFPYVLIKPILIIGPILGQMAGLATFSLFNSGTVGPVSPGSFIALLAMTPRDSYLGNIAGYVISAAVSFAVAGFLLRIDKNRLNADGLDEGLTLTDQSAVANDIGTSTPAATTTPAVVTPAGAVNRVALICDAGMGSSVMGAGILKKKVQKAELPIEIVHASIDDMPNDVDVIVTNKVLESRVQAKLTRSDVPVWTISNFLDNKEYDGIVRQLSDSITSDASRV